MTKELIVYWKDFSAKFGRVRANLWSTFGRIVIDTYQSINRSTVVLGGTMFKSTKEQVMGCRSMECI